MTIKNLYKPKDKFHITIIKNFIWGILGITLGIIMNYSYAFIFTVFGINLVMIQDITRLILSAFVLTIIQFSLNYFGWTWQNTTPGLFFTWFFFGIQTLYKIN